MRIYVALLLFILLLSYHSSCVESKDVWTLTGSWSKSIITTYCYYSLIASTTNMIKEITTYHVYSLFEHSCPLQPNKR